MKIWRILLRLALGLFVGLNLVICHQAYRFTHYADPSVAKTKPADQLSWGEKLRAVLIGVGNPKPINLKRPPDPYTVIRLPSQPALEVWRLPSVSVGKGTVILFHGYGGSKSGLLGQAAVFQRLGYRTCLVDFRGSGGSEGQQTTIGYREADDVKAAFEYFHRSNTQPVYLFGTSMGAVAILRAIHLYGIQPTGVILECPFGTMYQTTANRFTQMGIPAFPLAGFLVFWGGVCNGFWAFSHNPVDYAPSVTCPVLLLYGEQDVKVSRPEIDSIFHNLHGRKRLVTFPFAGHENYLGRYEREWTEAINTFLNGQ